MWFTIQGTDGETGCALSLTIDVPSLQFAREYALLKGIAVSTILPEADADADADPPPPPVRVIDYAGPIPARSRSGRSEPARFGVAGRVGRVIAFIGVGSVGAGVASKGFSEILGGALVAAGFIVTIVGVVTVAFDHRSGAGREP